MKLIDNKLYLEFNELVECGVSDNYMRKAKSQQYNCWHFIDDPVDRRRVLIGYDELKDKYKEMVVGRFGDPYLRVVREPILAMVREDKEDYQYFFEYNYGSGKRLPIDVVRKYTRAAAWMRMLTLVKNDLDIIRKDLGIKKLPDFYKQVTELMDAEKRRGMDKGYTGAEQLPGDFASSYSRIMINVKRYAEEGRDMLIEKMYGNNHTAKIKEGETSEALLLELLNHANQYDDVYVAMAYNSQAAGLGLGAISASTVRVWREKNKHLVKAGREGWQEWNRVYGRRTHRARPSQPGYLWESDDNHLDLLYIGDDNSPYHRMKMIVVTDSYCDLVLGYAVSEHLSIELVRRAYIDAMYYVKQLTGGWYLPHEIKTDRWGLASLKPFYESIGHYYPTPVGSKNRGWLENFFGTADWKRCLKVGAINYTGHNVTAKNTGVNLQALKENEKMYPHISEAPRQIAEFIHRLRKIDMTGKGCREQQWLERWANLPDSEKRPITDEMMLSLFGLKHEANGAGNRIDRNGISFKIGGVQHVYDVPHELYLRKVGARVEVQYDPYDMSRILVTGDEGLRFVATAVKKVPGTMRDMELYGEGGRRLLNQTLDKRREDMDSVIEKSVERMEKLKVDGVDIEHVLRLGGVVPKELMQGAEVAYRGRQITADNKAAHKEQQREQKNWEEEQNKWLDNQVDWSQF